METTEIQRLKYKKNQGAVAGQRLVSSVDAPEALLPYSGGARANPRGNPFREAGL